MQGLAEFQMVREHNEELLREAKRRRLARELRVVRREERPLLRSRVWAALRATPKFKSSLRSAGQDC